ncbi:MAG: HDOD domain-containing protein [Oscillospiraceae bacterium]|nr:HDOD domain-containing protein [Oscillospiraceae bacterium]
MKTLIVAIPFFDSEMSVEAYRINSRAGETLLGMMDNYVTPWDAVLSPGLDLVKTLGIEPLSGVFPLYVDINEYHLLMGIPMTLGILPEKLVCVLPNNIKPDAPVLNKCRELRELGFRIAVDGFLEGHTSNPLFELLDCVIVDTRDYDADAKFIETMKKMAKEKQLILSDIPDMDSFKKLTGVKGALYSGRFYKQPITKGKGDISPVKINAITLLNQINEEDFELSDIAGTIERDPSLSISLLKFINSVMPQKINSIRNAVAILGQKEVKRWATAALSLKLAEDRPGEITKVSLIRASFAENLAKPFNMGTYGPSLFMMGLFSLLDIILEKPMQEAANEISLDEHVREALVENKGDFYKVMEFIYAYERANWDDVAIKMVQNNLDLDEVTTAFIDSLVWYKALLDAIGEDYEYEVEFE